MGEHTHSGLAVGMVVGRKMPVNQYFVENYSFAFKGLDDEVLHRPERVFGERVGAQPILIAYHDEAEVEVLGYESQVCYCTLDKFQLVKRVYLFVGRFFYECAVAVDE